jgi:hypothetical protein
MKQQIFMHLSDLGIFDVGMRFDRIIMGQKWTRHDLNECIIQKENCPPYNCHMTIGTVERLPKAVTNTFHELLLIVIVF